MKKTHLSQMQALMIQRFGPDQGGRISQFMEKEFETLCSQSDNLPPDMIRHTRNNIFPVVTAFRAMLAEGIRREEAAAIAGDSFLTLMEQPASMIRKAMKVPGLYRLMPWLWKKLMPKLFPETAGFRFRFYPTTGKQVKFDMLECPYFRICQELGCPELGPVFCDTDDVCYGHMHEKLIWNRTKTMARGGDVCDFDLYIPEK